MTTRIQPKFNANAMKVLCKRYLRPLPDKPDIIRIKCPHCGEHHETPSEMIDRATFGNDDYYNLLASFDFLPNSPTLFNAGTGNGTFSACFKFDVEDSLEGIMDVARKAAFVQKWGGGVGYCLSAIRPKGKVIRSTHGKACGPIAVLRLYHSVALMITQGGKREGAQMGILLCDHEDIREFIHCKEADPEAFSTFNLSVACTDKFMQAAHNAATVIAAGGTPVTEGKEAYDLLREMADSCWKTGDPGCFFIDTAEKANPTPWLGKLTGTNPCGEVPLLNNEPCNLGSINLSHMIDPRLENDVAFDFDKLERTARLATRYLDDVLDRNSFPDPAITRAAQATRKLGLGVMGWADTLALLGTHYDSDVAVAFADKVMSIIQRVAHSESIKLAQEKGVCPAFVEEGGYGTPQRRNAALTCIAPSGTISVLAGCSSGIEPYFTLEGSRAMGDGTQLEERIRVDSGGFRPKTAHEIGWSWHIKHQARFQRYTDLAVSKTINMPESATPDDIFHAFIMAWNLGCKGITCYRDKSRAHQVIVGKGDEDRLHQGHEPKPVAEKSANGRRRMTVDAFALRHKFSVGGMEGYLHPGLFPDGKLGELFITGNKQGSTIGGLMDGIAILTSLALQYGVPVESIVNKMKGTRFEPAGFTGNKEIPMASSVLDYIFSYLGGKFAPDNLGKMIDTGMLCPDCGASAILEEGCLRCSVKCGWSRC